MILVDTNVLLRMVQPSHSMNGQVIAIISELRMLNEVLCVVPQSMVAKLATTRKSIE